MWFIFALLATFAWGSADLFYKKGAGEEVSYSHLNTSIMVGVVMGLHAIYMLLFGGVDYEAEIYVDEVSVGYHVGGSASFSVDITQYVKAGSVHDLVVRVKDDILGGDQPGGKQSWQFKSAGCSYTRTTGIWQTVWLEAVDPAGLASCRIVPDFDNYAFAFTPVFVSDKAENHR